MNRPNVVHDLRNVCSDEPSELREKLALAMDGIAAVFESNGLHKQGNILTAERYLKHAQHFQRLAAAIRGAE